MMLATGLIVFREVLEATLVIGIVLAATSQVAGSRRMVAIGVCAGSAGAIILAVSADMLAGLFQGTGQAIFNAVAMILAASMLAWHTVWMTKHGKELAASMSSIGTDVARGSKPVRMLGVVVAIAVLREGGEIVLFLWGIATSESTNLLRMAEGFLFGLGAGAVSGAGIYLGLLRIPTRYLFTATSGMITLLAAGMAAQAVTFLAAAGLIDVVDTPVWDSSWILREQSIAGRMLHTLIGYMDRPNSVQLLAWGMTVLIIVSATRWVKSARPAR